MPSTGRGRTPSRLTIASKRVVDIVLGTVLALIALPIVLVLAVALTFVLRCNPFFVQVRPGRDGQTFRILKLRTLPPTTPHYASKHDLDFAGLPRLCELMRRTHLDELPQLFLVPLGSMSLVGPRPRLPDTVEAVDLHFDTIRSAVRPGCTGLWQISTASNEVATGAPRFDLFYLRHASVRFDIWIMLRTVATVLGWRHPVEIDDVPTWVRGYGLVDAAAFVIPIAVAEESVAVELATTPNLPTVVPTPTPASEPMPVDDAIFPATHAEPVAAQA